MIKYLVLADGQSPHTVKWVNELVKSFEVYVISFNGFSDIMTTLLDDNHFFCFDTVVKCKGGNVAVLNQVLPVYKVIRYVNPDYINAHYITSYGTVAIIAAKLSRFKGKLIMSTWGTDILVTPWKNIAYLCLTKMLLRMSDLVTSDSQYMTDKIHDIYACSNVMTFPFGIERLPEIEFVEKDYDLFFSNRAIELNYNINRVIEYFAEIRKRNSTARLIVANDGNEIGNLMKQVEQLGLTNCVEFVGFLTKKEQDYYYRKCGYYFSLPTSDSTSVSLLEAMAYGCIPLVSDLPANKEWVEHNKNGYIVKDVSFIECLDKKAVFGKNRDLIKRRAIWADSVNRYIDVLNCM